MKRLIAPIMLIAIVCSFFIIFGDSEAEKTKTEDNEPKIERELTRIEKYEGTWVNKEIDKGSYTLTLAFESENKAKMEYKYSDFLRVTPASFTVDVEFNEYGEGMFSFVEDGWGHEGRGDVFLEEDKVTIYIKTNKGKSGAPFGVKERITEFKKPEPKKVEEKFKQAIETKVKMNKKGYIPKEEAVYYYQTKNGIAQDYEAFTMLKDKNMSANPFNLYVEYEVDKNNVFRTDQYNNKEVLLQLPIKNGDTWESSDRGKRTVIKTDYILYGLEDVIIVKSEYRLGKDYNNITYEYYHKDFGRVAMGAEKEGKPHVEWLLVGIKKK